MKLEIPITIGSIALLDVNAIDPDLPRYDSLNNYNLPYREIYNEALPPSYSSLSGECKISSSLEVLGI